MGNPAMHRVLLPAIAGFAGDASAQTGTGEFAWQVSTDNGGNWAGGVVEVPPSQGSVLVRGALASWSSDGGMYAFGSAQFDVVVSGAAAEDRVTNETRTPYVRFQSQTIAVTRFAGRIKIDDARDALPPGEGPRGVFPAMMVQNLAGMLFTTAGPLWVFEFTLHLGPTPGDRDITSLFIAPSGDIGNTIDRVVRIYTSRSGLNNVPSTTVRTAVVRVVPAPGATGLLLMGALAPLRRGRGKQS